MLKKIIEINFINDKTYAIIGIVLGEIPIYNVLLIDKNKTELSIVKSFATQDFSYIQSVMGSNIPLVLNFSGKGVISKKVDSKGNFLKEVLFNASSEDFYIYTLYQKDNNFVSVSRKEVINEQFELFEKANYNPVDYSIGPFVSYLAKQIINEDILVLEDFELQFQNQKLFGFINKRNSKKKYRFGNQELKSRDVTLFSSLLNFLHPNDNIEYEKEFLEKNLEERKFKKLFDFLAVGTIVFFLVALLSSYLLLNYFNNEHVRFEEQLYHFNDSYSQIKKMEEELKNKQFIVENAGILNRNFISYYIHEIGNSTPDQILLSSMKINPTKKKIKKNEEISIDSDIILIGGEANASIYINQWVKKLKTYTWVDKIEILKLNTSKNSKESFLLKIVII